MSKDMVVENFVLKLKAKGTDANLRLKQIIRRRVEQDRVVIVWRAAVEPFEFSDEPVSGVRFHQDGYVVIKRPSTLPDDQTLLQSCCVFTPDHTGDLAGRRHPRVGAITDFMLASSAAYIASTHQMIENVLVEQALKSSSTRVQAVH